MASFGMASLTIYNLRFGTFSTFCRTSCLNGIVKIYDLDNQ